MSIAHSFPDHPKTIGLDQTLFGLSLFESQRHSFSSALLTEHCAQRASSAVADPGPILTEIGSELLCLRDLVSQGLSERKFSAYEVLDLVNGIGTYRSLTFLRTPDGTGSLFQLSEHRDTGISMGNVNAILARSEWDDAFEQAEISGDMVDAITFICNKCDLKSQNEFITIPRPGQTAVGFSVHSPADSNPKGYQSIQFGINGGNYADYILDFNKGTVAVLIPGSDRQDGKGAEAFYSDPTELDVVRCRQEFLALAGWARAIQHT